MAVIFPRLISGGGMSGSSIHDVDFVEACLGTAERSFGGYDG